ncbi:flagellar basal-body rod protein FlgB [Gemmobacter aquatilis]|uniref:Flagellar basal-body rod protein FlgB n=1 Tax=Gemmobacter aquatilis TaxID=933059 RepID=A0A1H7YK27_9RHOB|nr:FlgB family protein [Gemmobacter aquatilis]SEM46460.1 flagellar basal-body rod protein FlgB [Gemmobacter aquatilis]
MFEKLEIVRMAQAMASHAAARQAEIARNIAHADTPGYKAQDLAPFAEAYAADGGTLRATRTGHLGVDSTPGTETQTRRPRGAASPDGNTVSLEAEMMRSAEVRQQHDLALSIYRSSARILRTSLGRG